MQAVLITRGSRGMALFVPGAPTVHIPIFGSDEIADVTGAGDTVMATLTLALAAGATFEDGGTAGQLRRRPCRDETRHRHRLADELQTVGDARHCGNGRVTWVKCFRATSSSDASRASAQRAARSPLPTAASTCCTSGTCAISRRPRRKPTSGRRDQ